MVNGFKFDLYGIKFENCFISSSRYENGNLRLSMFGINPETNNTEHFVDITIEQNQIKLTDDRIIVDTLYKPNMISQLIQLGIIKELQSRCIINDTIYPIYNIDLSKIYQCSYKSYELIAA